jgi:lysozyme
MNRTRLKALLAKHEEKRLKPYVDCCRRSWRECTCSVKGKLTIGIGRNLDDNGIYECEVQLMADNDIATARMTCLHLFPGFDTLTEGRQHVLLDMAFNMGAVRLAKFTKMIAAVNAREFERAADEMKDSVWYTQVGGRGAEDEHTMRKGEL